ncbi:MAG: HEPN domain-containing protein [Deltaproteobacteria bacterium]|nr:HEPN domain-containing protein [Deltaproteobacteria bacterium]
MCNIEKFKDDKDAYPELCFNAHQAAEKALKGFLVFLDIELIKTHNLALLTNKLQQYVVIPDEILTTADNLTNYSVITRYPIEDVIIEQDEYEQAIFKAKNCINWVISSINQIIKKQEEDNNISKVDPSSSYPTNRPRMS